ncbi:unnamed protein product [Ascophyllum nodosum]
MRKFLTKGCRKAPLFDVTGMKTGEYCAPLAPNGIVEVKSRNLCRREGCGTILSFGVPGMKTAEYYSQHAPDGMVDACRRQCKVANTRTGEYCAQHARRKCGVEGYGGREFGPHDSGKETIGNLITSGAKQNTVHPTPTKASRPSGGNRGSRKRVQHQDITFTASKRAVSRGSAGGVGTIPDIDGQISPVKRDFSVKTEVQLSL